MLNDQVIVRHFVSSDNHNFSPVRSFNLSHKASLDIKVRQLLDIDWSRIVISKRCMTLPDNSTYGLESDLDVFCDVDGGV